MTEAKELSPEALAILRMTDAPHVNTAEAKRAIEKYEETRRKIREARNETFAVTVERNGEPILTIETNCLSGKELSAEDEKAIRDAAIHLLAFLGEHH